MRQDGVAIRCGGNVCLKNTADIGYWKAAPPFSKKGGAANSLRYFKLRCGSGGICGE